MPTEPTDAAAIEASLEIAGERGGDLTPRVYQRLFERHPEMEAHFFRDSDDSIKGEMLMRVFEIILDFVGERRYAQHLIQSEVITHEGYEVPRELFATFFGIVVEVVREVCGTDWTPATEEVWRRTLADVDRTVSHTAQVPG